MSKKGKSQVRLFLCVKSAKNLDGFGDSDVVVKITETKSKKKIGKSPKATSNAPHWNYLCSIVQPTFSLTFVITDGGRRKCVTSVVIDSYQEETMHIKEFELYSLSQKPKDKCSAVVNVRFFLSRRPFLRQYGVTEKCQYFYDHYSPQFKTGDLILFQGNSPLDIVTQLESGTNYSHVGLVVEMPNPITEVREMYLLEVTQNKDEMIDVFFQSPRNGFSFFKLFERIHHYCGSAIWWCPLTKRLDLKSESHLIRYVASLHSETFHVINFVPPPGLSDETNSFLSEFGNQMKSPESLSELWSPILIKNALIKAGVAKPTDFREMPLHDNHVRCTPESIRATPCYKDAKLIYCLEALASTHVTDKSVPFIALDVFFGTNLLQVSNQFAEPFNLTGRQSEFEEERRTRINERIKMFQSTRGMGSTNLLKDSSGLDESKSSDVISSSDEEGDLMTALKTKMLTKNPDSSQSQSSEETKPDSATSNNTNAPTTQSTSSHYLQSISSAQQSMQPQQQGHVSFNLQSGNALQQPLVQQASQSQTQLHPSNPFFDANKQPGYEQVECYDWTEYFTKDGSNQPYYHSASLGKTVWEPPRDYLILKARRDQEEAAKRANSLVAQEMASHSHSGVRRHDNGNPFISNQDDAPVIQQQMSQQSASLNPFMQPTLINPFQAPVIMQPQSHSARQSIGQPSPNPSNPFATNSTTSAQQSSPDQSGVANLSTSQQVVNPFASNLTSSNQPTSSSSVSRLSSPNSTPMIVKREGLQVQPVVTQPAADNPFRPQQNSFLASQMLGNT